MLAIAPLLLLACPGPKPDDTGETDSAPDTAETGDSDETGESGESGETGETGDSGESGETGETVDSGDLPPDTGVVELHYTGHVTTSRGALVSASGGARWVGEGGRGAALCELVGAWSESGLAIPACPTCDWSFSLTLSGGAASGGACAALGIDDGTLEGWTSGWGWADRYATDDGGEVARAVLLYYGPPYSTWALVGYAGAPGVEVDGSASDATFVIPGDRYYYLPP